MKISLHMSNGLRLPAMSLSPALLSCTVVLDEEAASPAALRERRERNWSEFKLDRPGRIKEMIDKEWLSLASINTVIIDEADKFC